MGNDELECSYLLFLAYMISRQGFAYPVEDLVLLLLGAFWVHFSDFFAFFSHVGRILSHHSMFFDVFFFFDFLSILDGFGEDFGRVLGACFDVFSIFPKTANFVKHRVFA